MIDGQDTGGTGHSRLWLLRSSPDQVHGSTRAPGPAVDQRDCSDSRGVDCRDNHSGRNRTPYGA
jgi:hypothetical protein